MKLVFFCSISLICGYLAGTFFPLLRNQTDVSFSPETAFESPEKIDAVAIEDIGGRSITVTDKKIFNDFKVFFSESSKRENIVKVPFRYKTHIYSSGKATSFRVTEDGMILEDVPASQIQDGYIPTNTGLANLLERLFSASK